MRNQASILASESISVVDDVSDGTLSAVTAAADEQVHEARALGDGYVEIGGYVFYENWDEIDPPESDNEPEIPHEEVVAYIRDLVKELTAGK